MRRVEHPHNTPQQVREYLETAAKIVGELELDGDLKVPAFEKAVDLIAGKQIVVEQIAPGAIDLGKIRQG